jgi:imidazolonepropionase-like amidohydrolase
MESGKRSLVASIPDQAEGEHELRSFFMGQVARAARACLVVFLVSASVLADDKNRAAESARWRYFLREEKFNRLLLELAARHRPSSFVIRNATILDMLGAEALKDHGVLVEDGRIVKVAPQDSIQHRADRQEIDAGGKFLLPGLVDSHTHTLVTNAHYLLNLVNGVTTVREMCGFPWLLALRSNIRADKLLAPNVYLTGPILNHFEMEWYAVVVRDPERARALVREHHAAGYDFIKVHNVLRSNVYEAILDEANGLNIDVVGHIPHDIPLSKAIEHGQRTFEHLKGYYSDRTLELTKEDYVALTRGAQVWNCPTLYTHRMGLRSDDVQKLLTLEEAKYISADDRAAWLAAEGDGKTQRIIFEQSRKILQDLIPTEPKLIAGTDSGGGYPMMVPGFALHEELRLLHEAGLQNGECIKAATVNAAEAMRKTTEFGTIQAGRRADLVLVEGDPRADLGALSRIEAVCVRGIWLDRAALDDIRSRLREIFADVQGLAQGEIPSPEKMDSLVSAMVELDRRGAVQMDHNLRELREFLERHKRPTDSIHRLLASRGQK